MMYIGEIPSVRVFQLVTSGKESVPVMLVNGYTRGRLNLMTMLTPIFYPWLSAVRTDHCESLTCRAYANGK